MKQKRTRTKKQEHTDQDIKHLPREFCAGKKVLSLLRYIQNMAGFLQEYAVQKQINALFTIPLVPTMLAASTGENTNAESEVGITVFLIKLVRPKINPKNPPFFDPQNNDPKITGMWMMVALITTSGM